MDRPWTEIQILPIQAAHIAKLLYYFKRTGIECWANRNISTIIISHWDEEGDLLHTAGVKTMRPNEPDTVSRDEQVNYTTTSIGLNQDGGDLGPAHLQNGYVQEEEFEGFQNLRDDPISGVTAAHNTEVQLDAAVERIRLSLNGGVSNGVYVDTSGVRFSAGEHKSIFHNTVSGIMKILLTRGKNLHDTWHFRPYFAFHMSMADGLF
jgi:hypothetical protein